MKWTWILAVTLTSLFYYPFSVAAGKEAPKKSKKVQEVNFGDMDLLGTIRNPEGSYLVQRRGIRFLPLYDVQKDFDQRIRQSDMYMK